VAAGSLGTAEHLPARISFNILLYTDIEKSQILKVKEQEILMVRPMTRSNCGHFLFVLDKNARIWILGGNWKLSFF